jgi:hypothetical protein
MKRAGRKAGESSMKTGMASTEYRNPGQANGADKTG